MEDPFRSNAALHPCQIFGIGRQQQVHISSASSTCLEELAVEEKKAEELSLFDCLRLYIRKTEKQRLCLARARSSPPLLIDPRIRVCGSSAFHRTDARTYDVYIYIRIWALHFSETAIRSAFLSLFSMATRKMIPH